MAIAVITTPAAVAQDVADRGGRRGGLHPQLRSDDGHRPRRRGPAPGRPGIELQILSFYQPAGRRGLAGPGAGSGRAGRRRRSIPSTWSSPAGAAWSSAAGAVAARKVEGLVAAGAEVIVVAPEIGEPDPGPGRPPGRAALPAGRPRRGLAGDRRHRRPGGQPARSTPTARRPGSGSTPPTTRRPARSPSRPWCAGDRSWSRCPRRATARRWPAGSGARWPTQLGPEVGRPGRAAVRGPRRAEGDRALDRGCRLAPGARLGHARTDPSGPHGPSKGAPPGVSVVVVGLNHRTVAAVGARADDGAGRPAWPRPCTTCPGGTT